MLAHAHMYVLLWLWLVTASLGPLRHAPLCSLCRLVFGRARQSARTSHAGGVATGVGVASKRWVGLPCLREEGKLAASCGQEPATPCAMLFWTALSLALSLRLALARSGVESSKCGGTRIPIPDKPIGRCPRGS